MSDRFFEHAIGTSAGSLSPRTNWSSLANYEFDLPPLDQQRRIAEIFWAIDTLERSIFALKRATSSSLNAAIEHAISTNSESIKIGQLGTVVTGSTPPTVNRQYYEPRKHMFVSPGDIGDSRLVTSSEKMLSEEGLQVARIIPQGAIFVVCIGSTLGKIAMASKSCATNQQINSLICHTGRIPEVVYHVLCRQSDEIRSKATCTAVPLLNKSSFSDIEVKYPRKDKEGDLLKAISDHENYSESLSQLGSTITKLRNDFICTL
jgi:type I restriction enzyme S subunit